MRTGFSEEGWNGSPTRLEGAETTVESIATAVVGAVVGGAGFVGLVFYFMRRYIDNKLETREEKDKRQREIRTRRLKIEDEWQHAAGRLFYHIHKFVITGFHNGDLDAAFAKFTEAEEKKKELDREIIVENELEQ